MAEIKEMMNKENTINNGVEYQRPTTTETIGRQDKKDILQDVQERHQIPHEIKSWMEKIEEDPQQQRMANDDAGQAMLTPIAPSNPKVVLPSTRTTFLDGFKLTMDQAGFWLSKFIFRLIQKEKGNVKFKQE